MADRGNTLLLLAGSLLGYDPRHEDSWVLLNVSGIMQYVTVPS